MNSAERLLKIYDQLVAIRQSVAMRQVWAVVFELNEQDKDFEDNLVELLTAVRKQVDKSKVSLSAYGVPEDLTDPGFSMLKDTASTSRLDIPWDSLKGNIQAPECRLSFAWSAWVLNKESESELNNEGLLELLNELTDLETKILETDMPPKLRSFLKQKIKDIKNAILLSKVEGSQSLKDTFDSIVGSIITVDAEILEEINSSKDSQGIVNTFMQKFKEFAEFGDNIEKFIALSEKVGKAAGFLALKLLSGD
jgi:hypothetical protein